jgi:hypothetical protein
MCVPIDKVLRTEMYKNLIKTLIELHGYTKDDLQGNTYRRVMEASINPNSEKKEKWRMAATDDWMDAVDTFFPHQLLVHDSSTEPERPKREQFVKKTYVSDDAPIELENPLDRSQLTDIPPPNDEDDEEFLKLLRGDGDE